MGAYFGWKALWGLNSKWKSHTVKSCNFGHTLLWSCCAWTGVGAMTCLCITPWHSPYNWRKIMEKPQSVQTKVPSWTALGMIHCVDLATSLQTASTVLLTSVTLSLCFRWPGSTLGQLEYQPNCRDKRFLMPANFESNPSTRGLMWSAKNGSPTYSWICL